MGSAERKKRMGVMEEINIFRIECKKLDIDADKVFLIGRGSQDYKGRYRQSILQGYTCVCGMEFEKY